MPVPLAPPHHRTTGATQPARTDDEGRLLGPRPLNAFGEAVAGYVRNTPPPFGSDELAGELRKCVWQYEVSEAVAEAEACALSETPSACPECGAEPGCNIDCEWCLRYEGDSAESYYVDECQTYREVVEQERVDHHTRAQLVDGLPGEWARGPYDEHDPTRVWLMHFCGIDYRAVIDIDPSKGIAAGWVEMSDGNTSLSGSEVWAAQSDGDDYIMRCAELLKPKVEAVREMVDRLRGE